MSCSHVIGDPTTAVRCTTPPQFCGTELLCRNANNTSRDSCRATAAFPRPFFPIIPEVYELSKSSFGVPFSIIQYVQIAKIELQRELPDNHAVPASRLFTPVLAIMSNVPPAYDLSMIPLLPNPNPAIPSNFIDPPTLAPTVQGVGITLAVIAIIVVAIRLHSNARAARKLGLDDCMPL